MTGDAHTPAHELYHVGLRNAHAEETQAVETLSRQVERLESYPDLAAGLRRHIAESKEQIARLDGILAKHGTSDSSLKKAVTGLVGNLTAAVHAVMADEVLKNLFANYALEHHEIAAYTSLIAMAEGVGATADVPLLQKTLAEEQAAAKFIEGQIVPVTKIYMQSAAKT